MVREILEQKLEASRRALEYWTNREADLFAEYKASATAMQRTVEEIHELEKELRKLSEEKEDDCSKSRVEGS